MILMAKKEEQKSSSTVTSSSSWTVTWTQRPSFTKPILIEGLPGIANVGKISIDFIVDQRRAKKVADFFSFDLPHMVFVKEDNLVALPRLQLFHSKSAKHGDLLFLVGDVQPNNERSCYEFCSLIIDLAKELGVTQIITTGGIGLPKVPKNPKVYCTANDARLIKEFSQMPNVDANTHGVVGPIVGVTGLLVGLAAQHKIPAIALLAETFSHPMYLGMKSARALLAVLNERFSFKLNMNNLDSEISDIENEIVQRTKELSQVEKVQKDKRLNYIG